MKIFMMISLLFVTIISTDLNAQNLVDYTWENRILIVKTLNEESIKYKAQLEEFKYSTKELEDRKILLILITENHYEVIDSHNRNQERTGTISTDLQEMLNQENEFEIILIGLDGGVKLRKKEIIKKEELFSKIDSMPMRRSELRNRKE